MPLIKRLQKLEEEARGRAVRRSIPDSLNGFYADLEQNPNIINYLYPSDKVQ